MGFLDALKRRLQQGQDPRMLARVPPSPIGDPDTMPIPGTPEHEMAMSRAVPVNANEILQPADTMADLNATRQRAVSFDPRTGKPTDEFYQNKPDRLEGAQGLYDAYQKWEPRGGKRGFKQALKTGAMYAAEAIRNNPDHPAEAAIAGFGTGAIGGTAQPNFKNRLTRQWKLGQAGADLQSQLKIAQEKAKLEASEFVPMVIDGQVVQVPKKSAGTVALGNQRNTLTKDRDKARVDRLNRMSGEKRQSEIAKLLRSGDLNSPELLAYATDVLGLPENLKEHIAAGDIIQATDDDGTIQLVNKKTGAKVDTGIKSYETTKEAGRDERARASRAAAMDRTIVMANAVGARMGDPTEYETLAKEADADAAAAQEEADWIKNKTQKFPSDGPLEARIRGEVTKHKERATKLREAAIKARGGQGEPSSEVNKELVPKSGAKEDPRIRAYADEHFGGDYQKALKRASETGYKP